MSTTFESLRVRVSGPLACFSRPEMKVERVSYQVMTPSAARGILDAILWKPAIRWRVCRIWVLNSVRWANFRRNEVGRRMSPGGLLVVDDEKVRQQRNTLALAEVAYVIEAEFVFTARRGRDDHPVKFAEMFRRRVESGQCFHRPYLGCREFAADFGAAPDEPCAAEELKDQTIDLGLMLLDMEFRARPPHVAQFFHAELRNGALVERGKDRLPDAVTGKEVV